jgi:acetyl esterase/lipase
MRLEKMVNPCLVILVIVGMNLFSEKLSAQENRFIKIWPDQPLYSTTLENLEKCDIDKNNITRYSHVTMTTLEYFKPGKKNSAAVIICPGGGYGVVSYTYEGTKIAEWFAQRGISAFVLKYRMPDDKAMEHKEKVPLADAQQALNFLKMNVAEYGIDPDKIGIIGFSAGGHLASTVSTHFSKPAIKVEEKINLRPFFSILIYPVITMNKELTHGGSRKNLLGDNPDEQLVAEYSNELNVTPNTPPTFIVHAADDKTVPVQNSINYYQSLLKNNVPAAIHIFEKGGHGFSMHNPWIDEQWLFLLDKWMKENNIIN